MENRLHVEIPFLQSNFSGTQDLERAIADLIVEHQASFQPLFENLIDTGDARISVMNDSLSVNDVSLSGKEGCADIEFCSDFYAGCKDMNSTGEHEYVLEFEITPTHILFDVEIPPAWKPDYY